MTRLRKVPLERDRKKKVKRLLDNYGKALWYIMPVPYGYGATSLDFLVCINGFFMAIETKRDGGELTDRQRATMRKINDAGGIVLLIDNDDALDFLGRILNRMLRQNPRQRPIFLNLTD